jgi:hypothetical protein
VKKTRLFYVAKFNSLRLKQAEYNIKRAGFKLLRENNEIVSLADNQALRCIRAIQKNHIDFDLIDELMEKKKQLEKMNEDVSDQIMKIELLLQGYLYMPEYVTVVIDQKVHYRYLSKNGFCINGKMYYRYNASAGQARASTVVFVREDVIDKLNFLIDNGRDKGIPLCPSKYNAYKGLSCSSTFEVSTPRFCVIPDYYSDTEFEADVVIETDDNEDDIIERQKVKRSFNRFDGMGLISPTQSKKWAEELGLDYIPAQWCVRQSFLKGMLCTFNFETFARQRKIGYEVQTIYGDYVDVREMDVIVTESQFKLWESYVDLEEYKYSCKLHGLSWGVSLVTPEKDKDILNMNYQFLQTLNLGKNEIKDICSKFVNWVEGVTGDDIYYTLLFLMGTHNTDSVIRNRLLYEPNSWLASLAVCNDLIKDRFIRSRILDVVKKKIKDASLGVIMLDGNYQVIVSDPFAFAQHMFGIRVNGLLKKGEYYSHYWNQKGVSKISAMRPPLTHRSEHLNLKLVNRGKMSEWFAYCKTGIILNVHGHETCNFAGSDKFLLPCTVMYSEKNLVNSK